MKPSEAPAPGQRDAPRQAGAGRRSRRARRVAYPPSPAARARGRDLRWVARDRLARRLARSLRRSAQPASQHRGQHLCVAALDVARGKHQRQPAVSRAPPQVAEHGPPGGQLANVAAAELLEATGVVAVPAAQRVARRDVARPLADSRVLPGEATRPDPVDQHSIAVGSLGRLVGALEPDIYATALRPVAGASCAPRLLTPPVAVVGGVDLDVLAPRFGYFSSRPCRPRLPYPGLGRVSSTTLPSGSARCRVRSPHGRSVGGANTSTSARRRRSCSASGSSTKKATSP